jgi:quercetin dioxygenase-like cupin family protein
VTKGDGYAVAQLDDLGEGWGFRKVRKELGVTAFGVNAIVMPPNYESGKHYHEEQEELYFVYQGQMEINLDGTKHALGPGSFARVDAKVVRSLKNLSEDEDAIYICVGGKDGYVGRDGRLPEGETDPRNN